MYLKHTLDENVLSFAVEDQCEEFGNYLSNLKRLEVFPFMELEGIQDNYLNNLN